MTPGTGTKQLKTSKKYYWFLTALVIAVIFFLMLFGKPLLLSIKHKISLGRYLVLVVAGWSLALAFLGWLFYAVLRLRRPSTYLLLALLMPVYLVLFFLVQDPEETIHYLEYGLLVYFLYRALRFEFSSTGSGICAVTLGSLIGILEESLQLFVPQRFFTLNDLAKNIAACLLGLAVTAIIERERNKRIEI